MSPTNELQVLIVGAGPTGLTLACELARRGVRFRLLEATPSPFEGSRGKGLQPRTLEIFDDLGVIAPILSAGGPYPKFRFHLGPLSLRLGSFSSRKQPSDRTPYPEIWMVPQSRTEAILRERLLALGGRVEFGQSLVGFSQDERGVEARLASGEIVRADYLIGADGGHSQTRKTLGLKLKGESVDERAMVVADIEVPGLDRRDWHIWPLAKGGALALCPLPNSSLFQLAARATTIEGDVDHAIRRATGRDVASVAWSSTYQPAVRMVERYRVGCVLLAGDAAHMHPPAGGQGLNTAVQDAYNLGWKLAYVVGGGPETLLDSYEAERLPIAAAVLGLSKTLHQTGSLKRGDLTSQLGLNYRESALSSGRPFGALHPGDRMPDARLADGARLFDRLRGPQATEIVTPNGTRILVRPDGYIARIGATPVADYAGAATRQLIWDAAF